MFAGLPDQNIVRLVGGRFMQVRQLDNDSGSRPPSAPNMGPNR